MIDQELYPHNLEAEQSIIGAVLIDADAVPRVAAILETEDFHNPQCRQVWSAVLTLHNRGEPVDLLTVGDELEKRGQPDAAIFMIQATDLVPTSVHAEHYAKMVERLSTRRKLLGASGQIAKAACDESQDLDAVEDQAMNLILGARSRERRQAQPVSALVRAYYDRIEALQRSDRALGLPTGYPDLDGILGGLQRSDLVLLAARPRVGKTSLALCMARNAAKLGERIAFFSLEMSSEQVTRRLVSLESNIAVTSLKTGKLLSEEWPAFMQATDTIDRLPIWVDDTPGATVEHIRAGALRIEAQAGGLNLIIVDYLQLMRGKSGMKRYELVTEIGQGLKMLAKDLNVPVLALSQLNRECENRGDKRPQLHDLRESGDLEQTANVVLFLYRDELYNPDTEHRNIADVHVAKNRDGSEGTINLWFEGHLTRFSNVQVRNVSGEVL